MRRIAQTGEALRRVARRINDGAEKVAVGAARQVEEAHQTHEDAEGLIQALGDIATRASAVSQDSRSGADSAARLGALSTQVAQSVQSAQNMVDETAASVTQLAQSISEVARRTTDLAQSAPATSAAIARMDQSIERVRANAATAARDATQVASDAARGGTALRETLAGIERIHDTSAKVTEVTLALEAQIGQIGNILAVINELADRTNLLALNASIIAAQAGEHGRGFAVVATEIKDLARRTTHSIGEIGQLIDSVQAGAQAARAAVEDGARAVESGASQARHATALLSEILERVRGSTRATQAIADATDEQARGSASVTTAMQQVADNVRQIAAAASEQARGAGHIRDLTESLREVVTQVGGASREQREGARLLAELTSKVTDMVEALSRLQGRQSQAGERIRVATAAIRDVANEHRDTVAGDRAGSRGARQARRAARRRDRALQDPPERPAEGSMPAVDLVVRNIGQLVTCSSAGRRPLGLLRGAAVAAADGRVVYVGSEAARCRSWPTTPWSSTPTARCAPPGSCEPHAHPVFAGERAGEFAMRVEGRTYLEIQARRRRHPLDGARRRAAATDDGAARGRARAPRAAAGVRRDHLRGQERLRARRRGRAPAAAAPPAARGARARGSLPHPARPRPPPRSAERPRRLRGRGRAASSSRGSPARGWPRAATSSATAGAFTIDETRRHPRAAKAAGLALRLHAEQFADTGAAALAAELGARSADHLERDRRGGHRGARRRRHDRRAPARRGPLPARPVAAGAGAARRRRAASRSAPTSTPARR